MDKLIHKRIETMLGQLKSNITPVRIDIDNWLTKKCDYKTDNTIPVQDNSWTVFAKSERWGFDEEEHRWFIKTVEIPEELKGKDIEMYIAVTPPHASEWNPQFIVYVNGKEIRGLDSNHRYVKLDSEVKSYDIAIYAYGAPYSMKLDLYTQLCVFNREVEKLYYDILTPYEVMEYHEINDKIFGDIRLYLNNALNLINWCDVNSEEFNNSIKLADKYLETEFYGKYCRTQDIQVKCIGHTHIDVAWLWTLKQTREKVQRTFGSVIEMMKKYPEYKFMTSQPQLLKYLKEEAPDMYKDFQQLVKDGRVETEGAMWVEADCNLSSGESLVRQILFGKRFFLKEFGKDNKIVWLPDVFGYSAAMPQIMQKSGIDKFVTSKISWNETNRMPYDTFMWKGIDGTKVFSYFMTSQRKQRNRPVETGATYTAAMNPAFVQGAWDRFEPKDLTDEILMPFGYGDGGGGPSDEYIEKYKRLAKGINGCPQTEFEFASTFLERKKNQLENNPKLPVWAGELYLEFHRGTYTSQAYNKRCNRKSEFAYQNAETLSVIANKLTDVTYPQDKLNEGWECILLNQFHDIIPGSSIHSVYEQCHRDYDKIFSFADEIKENAYNSIISNVKSKGGVIVFNPNSFAGNGFVRYNGKSYKVDNIPAKGWKVIELKDKKANYTLNGRTLETDNYIVEFDESYAITRLYDKNNGRNALRDGGRGNYIEAYEDYPYEYDNWEISKYYTEKKYEINDVSDVKFIDENARFGFKIIRKFYNSTITQNIFFYENSNRIDFDTKADWHQHHIMVKTAFDVDVNSDKATFEIQFGSVERPVHKNTSWEDAKFEVCAHKYIDYSDYGYGLSLINDCKYGHNIENGTMKLSMFKCGTHPDPEADQGEHIFTYTLLPHCGNYREAGTVQLAYELNNPMQAFEIKANDGTLSDEYSLVSCNSDNFIVETIKKAEDEDAVIVRGYESYNKRTDVELTVGFNVKEAYICDLMEKSQNKLEIKDNKIKFTAKPFEIVSVKLY